MKQMKELDINKKQEQTYFFNTLKDVIARVEKLEETKSDNVYYKLPGVNVCSYSLI